MFKKPFQLQQQHKISRADRKKLKQRFQKLYPEISDEDLEKLIPQKSDEIELGKLQAPSRIQIYFLGQQPIIIDTSGKGDLVPTVYTFWVLDDPHFIPRIYVKHDQVSHYIIGGADLMLPGVQLPLDEDQNFARDDICAVYVQNNPNCVAVGRALMSSGSVSSAFQKEGADIKGKLLEVFQVYRDRLHQLAPSQFRTPNSNFQQDQVLSYDQETYDRIIQEKLQMKQMQQEQAQQAQQSQTQNDDGEVLTENMQQLNIDSQDPQQAVANEDLEQQKEPKFEVSLEEMDYLLLRSMLQALHKDVPDEVFPLLAQQFWKQYMLPSRPLGTQIDFKKSSYKKLQQFFKVYSSSDKNILEVIEDKYSHELIIQKVNREHELYKNHKTYKSEKSAKKQEQLQEQQNELQESQLQIEELLKPTFTLKKIFEIAKKPFNAIYSYQEASEIPFLYAQIEKLDQGMTDKSQIKMDPHLTNILFATEIKQKAKLPLGISKAELRQRFISLMSPVSRISRGEEENITKGKIAPIMITTEKRMGNKKVTKVSGLETFFIPPTEFAADVKQKFATATSLQQNLKVEDVFLQGDKVAQVAQLIQNSYRVPQRFISAKESTGKKKK